MIPHVGDGFARGQAVGVIDLINNIAPRVEWARAPLLEGVRARRQLLRTVAGLLGGPAPEGDASPEAMDSAELERERDRLDGAICDAMRAAHARSAGDAAAYEALGLIIRHAHDEAAQQMKQTRKPPFAEISTEAATNTIRVVMRAKRSHPASGQGAAASNKAPRLMPVRADAYRGIAERLDGFASLAMTATTSIFSRSGACPPDANGREGRHGATTRSADAATATNASSATCSTGSRARQPDKVFANFADGTEWTYAQTREIAIRTANAFRRLGVRQGDRVLVWLPNSADCLRVWFGLNYLGAVFVPINLAYRGALARSTRSTFPKRGSASCTPTCTSGSAKSSANICARSWCSAATPGRSKV